jgi:Delta7-sterol 5-desaturase
MGSDAWIRAIAWLRGLPPGAAAALFFGQNLLVFAGALAFGAACSRAFAGRRVAPPPPPLERAEVLLAAATVILNSLITLVGWVLWRRAIIGFRDDLGLRAWLDVPILLVAMDAAMYLLHRIAHHRWIYPLLHRPHHRYVAPRPLTLFVLHPAETAAFGGLWLAVCWLFTPSWMGMMVYLTLNVVFGVVGHLGVEPLPRLGLLANARFHAGHHADETHNFGFYTLIWDRLFGTLLKSVT